MICKVCGKELDDDAKFCNYCGAEIHKEEHAVPSKETVETVEVVEKTSTVEAQPRKYVVFSRVSKIVGIVTMCLSVVPFLNLYLIWEFAIVGIVMGCLGKKATAPETIKDASLGLKLSIAALVVSLVLGLIMYIIFAVVVGVGTFLQMT